MRIPLLRIPSFSPVSSFSSEARNLPCTPLKRRLRDNDETKNRRFLRFLTNAGAAITLRSLGSARDNDTGGRAISHPLSSLLIEGCPCGADLSSAFGAPLLQGATLLACKNGICERNQYSLKYENTASLTFPFTPLRKPTSAPSGHLLPKEGGNIHTIPRTKAFPA